MPCSGRGVQKTVPAECGRKGNIMNRKVLLILADGFRPDALSACRHPFAQSLLEMGSYCLDTRTVYPSVTLPCHMSLFHSVSTDRHGILTNTFVPMARPVSGLCEQLAAEEKTCAFFYDWEELRDLTRPGSLAYSYYVSGNRMTHARADRMVTENALEFLEKEQPDFAFVYLGLTDHVGHSSGWMEPEYLEACRQSLDETQQLVERFREDYTIFFTADHGGHGRNHGSAEDCDMKIPLICIGPDFTPGPMDSAPNIMDLAPTITRLMGVRAASEWEGQSLV